MRPLPLDQSSGHVLQCYSENKVLIKINGHHVDLYLEMVMKILIKVFSLSSKEDMRTRGHKVRLMKDQCRLDIRKYSFSKTTIN